VFKELVALREAYVCMSLIEVFDEAVKFRVLKRMEKLQTSVFSIVNAKEANKDDAATWRVPLLCDFVLCYMLAGERETAYDYLREASYLEAKVWVHSGVQDQVAVLIRTLEGDAEYVEEFIRSSPYLSQDSPVAKALEKLVMQVPQTR